MILFKFTCRWYYAINFRAIEYFLIMAFALSDDAQIKCFNGESLLKCYIYSSLKKQCTQTISFIPFTITECMI